MADKIEWRPVVSYEGLYEVSNFGEVRSLPHVVNSHMGTRISPGKILRQAKSAKTGYYSVCLSKNNKSKMELIHRIVATAFIPNENNYPQVNHKDENKSNNSADNLEWCTAEYNNNYGTIKQRISAKNKISKCKPVAQMLNGVVLNVFPSTISARHIADPGHIGKVCNGKRKSAGGYQWAFVNGG
jgi:hypothetical protein